MIASASQCAHKVNLNVTDAKELNFELKLDANSSYFFSLKSAIKLASNSTVSHQIVRQSLCLSSFFENIINSITYLSSFYIKTNRTVFLNQQKQKANLK